MMQRTDQPQHSNHRQFGWMTLSQCSAIFCRRSLDPHIHAMPIDTNHPPKHLFRADTPPHCTGMPRWHWSTSRTLCADAPQKQLRNSPRGVAKSWRHSPGFKMHHIQIWWSYMLLAWWWWWGGVPLEHGTVAMISSIHFICQWVKTWINKVMNRSTDNKLV